MSTIAPFRPSFFPESAVLEVNFRHPPSFLWIGIVGQGGGSSDSADYGGFPFFYTYTIVGGIGTFVPSGDFPQWWPPDTSTGIDIHGGEGRSSSTDTVWFGIPRESFVGLGSFFIEARIFATEMHGGDLSTWRPSPAATLEIRVTTFPPLAPTNLSPSNIQQNRREPIVLTWEHNPRPGTDDPQLRSQVQFWQGDGIRTTITIEGEVNEHTIPAYTFQTEAAVNFIIRTEGGNGAGWGAWSEQVSFPLITINAPQPPINLRPYTTQNPTRQFRLEWTFVPAEGHRDSWDGAEVEFWQGNGVRTVLEGEFGNRVTLMADTFLFIEGGTAEQNRASFRARTHGLRGGWGDWSAVQTFQLELQPPLAPTNLSPTDEQNRRAPINLSWRNTPNPADWDNQNDSEVEYWQDNNLRTSILAGVTNRLGLPMDTFTDNRNVHWRARTSTLRNGWGPWSTSSSFSLYSFPPLAPVNLLPDGDERNPNVDIELRWRHVRNPRWFTGDDQVDSEAEVRRGSGTVHTYRGFTDNRAIIPQNTFSAGAPLSFRARTESNLGGWGPWSTWVSFPLIDYPALPPEDVRLLTEFPNTIGDILITFRHVRNPDASTDRHVGGEIRVRQSGGWMHIPANDEGVVTIPANTFSGLAPLEFQARTRTEINGWGAWSGLERIDVMATPPLAPVLLHPVNFAVRAAKGVHLEWAYNSPFDTFPTRFDIRYRIGDRPWSELTTRSQDGMPAPNIIATPTTEINQSRIEWQVRAYSALNEVGPWSDIAIAPIIGIPPVPVIVEVTNSARPLVTFSAVGAMAWELEIPAIGYSTGQKAFEGAFTHRVEVFVPNGTYTARLRTANEYGIQSEWAELSFTVSTVAPPAIKLRATNNLEYHTRLWFEGTGRKAYIYRNDICIARVEDVDDYNDWTVQPGVRYVYFIRAIGDDYAFADSAKVTAMSDFRETTIAPASRPWDMVKMQVQLGGKPTKNETVDRHRSLTQFTGREKPVVQVGEHTTRTRALAFYVTHQERDRLYDMVDGEILILRDWRLGAAYGTIQGGITSQSDGFGANVQVSFTFTETDYPVEVKI